MEYGLLTVTFAGTLIITIAALASVIKHFRREAKWKRYKKRMNKGL